jgi:hypothetical protein
MKNVINKFIKFYGNINLATKSLIIIGLVSLIETILTVFFDTNQVSANSVAIRSVMSSIFGFIFGAQLSENSNIESRNVQTQVSLIVSLACLITIILGHWINTKQDGAAIVEIRNLLFSAVGFLLSRAKHSS